MTERSWLHPSPEGALRYLRGFDWSNLPEGMKVEILCRLPDRPLNRLKCVSKYWYFLISNACIPIISPPSPFAIFCGFIYTRSKLLNVGIKSLNLFPYEEYCDEFYPRLYRGKPGLLESYPALLPFEHRPEDLQDCCNGLLLLAHIPTEYYVCNPATCECIAIPPINPMNDDDVFDDNNESSSSSSYFASLIFDPSDSPTSFKIVRRPASVSSSSSGPLRLKLDVFSSNPGNWSTHILPLDHVLQGGFNWIDRSVYLNRVLYLLSLSRFLVCIRLSIKDPKTNMTCRQAMELPEKKGEFDDCGSLGVVRGSLVYSNCNKSKILIWLLEDGVRWKLQHRVCIDELVKIPRAQHLMQCAGHDWDWIKVYGFNPKSGEIYFGTPSVVQSYDPQTNKLKLFDELPHNHVILRGGQYNMFPYSRCTIILNSATTSSSTRSGFGLPACGFRW